MDGKNDILRMTMKPSRPIELMDFVKSCAAIASEYNDFATEHGAPDCRLYVKDVRHGSVEIDLVTGAAILAAVQQILPFAEVVNVMADFLGHVRKVGQWLLSGDATARENPFTAKTIENMRTFLEPVAKDKGANVTLQVVNVAGDVNAPIMFTSSEANYAQNVARRIDDEIASPNVRRFEQTVLRWHQSRNSVSDRGGDMSIVPSVCDRPVRTVFADRKLKALLLSVKENIFSCDWLVDVTAEYIGGVPKLYKIESIERLETAQPADGARG